MPFCCLTKTGQLLDQDRPCPNRQHIMMLQYDYEVKDFTDESDTMSVQQHVYLPGNKNKMQFSTDLFINIAPEWVNNLPDNIDGMKIFKIKCLPREWV